jgi:hypothetical protein
MQGGSVMSWRQAVVSVGLSLAAVSACSTTQLQSTWRDPGARPGELTGRRVAAFVRAQSESLRRSGEEILARQLRSQGIVAIPGYQLVSTAEQSDWNKVREKLVANNVDGLVLMRIVDSRQQVSWGGYVGPYGPYYGYYWPGMGWGPTYFDTVVSAETLVYDLPDYRLVWAGYSETLDPLRLDLMIRDIADKSAKEMRRQGLLHK